MQLSNLHNMCMCCFSVNRVTGKDAVESLECDKNYAQGNSMELQKYLAEITDKTDANFKV